MRKHCKLLVDVSHAHDSFNNVGESHIMVYYTHLFAHFLFTGEVACRASQPPIQLPRALNKIVTEHHP